MRKSLGFFFLLFLFASAFAAQCPADEKKIYLAAVTGEDMGGIFQLEVETRPGSGLVYTSILPRTGFATQESEEAAVEYAFSSAGMDRGECDVLFRINGDFGGNTIDGPSAGGAMAVATRAALLGKSIRQDMVMTGTVSSDGRVGEVGGVIEKSIAASDSGAAYFLVPKLKVHEALLISSISSTNDFRAIEVQNVSEAEDILFSPHSEKFSSHFEPEIKPVPQNLPQLRVDAELGRFSLVAAKVVDELDAKVRMVFSKAPKNNETAELREYFNKEISKYYSLISKGYPFTAANAAFLLSIDAEYVKIGDAEIDLDGSMEEVGKCIADLEKPKKTRDNIHWAIGSDLRRIWAGQKLNQTKENRLEQGGYASLRDLLFAYSWCGISSELAGQAEDVGGEPADESVLSELANSKILEAEETLSSASRLDYDASWHLDNAYAANESGEYGAAVYEATYAQAMQKISSESVENASSAAEKLSASGRSSLWGKIYYGQGMYIYADAEEGGFSASDAYRILKYSSELDRAAADIDRELLKKRGESEKQAPQNSQAPGKAPTELDAVLAAALALLVAAFGLASVYRLARKNKGGKNG